MKLNRYSSILFTTELGCRIAKLCAAFLALLIVSAALSLLSSWWGELRLIFLSEATVLSSPDDELLAVIPKAHLFGQQLPSSTAGIPITSAPLKLTGLIQLNTLQGPIAKAIISMGGGIGKVYQEGDILPGGLRLASIGVIEVLLDNAGHLERLPLQRSRLEKKI